MRRLMGTWAICFALFSAVAAYTQLIQNSRILAGSSHVLRLWAEALPHPDPEESALVKEEILHKALLYDEFQIASHLEKGMLVNRTLSGRTIDQCDSLLFSSLRYVALHKLGFHGSATEAWDAIKDSEEDGYWFRHPLCAHKGTSKDMLIGVLAAWTQRPRGSPNELRRLMHLVDQTGGFFSHGPVYVSYLTPTVARLLKIVGRTAGVPYTEMPDILRRSYSTTEFSFIAIDGGFQSHLAAMSVWLQLEARGMRLDLESLTPFDGEDGILDWLAYPLRHAGTEAQRLNWITSNLVRLNPKNLFYRYLRLKTAGALNDQTRHLLRKDLLAMTAEFPDDRLPLDCDRKGDYLWQRAARDYRPRWRCTREYSGVDFLWMAALLLEEPEVRTTAEAH